MPEPRRADKAFTPHPAISNAQRDCNLPQWFRQHRTIRRLLALIATVQQAYDDIAANESRAAGSAT
ncbi:hypothetical protein ACO2XV_01215 [Escherichia coli]